MGPKRYDEAMQTLDHKITRRTPSRTSPSTWSPTGLPAGQDLHCPPL